MKTQLQVSLWPEVSKHTPLMQQYYEMKAKHADALLLFRVGDFYETFGEDAIKTASALDIILTKRNNGGQDIELAGFPYHVLDNYLPRLVKAGFRVAICEQLEKPSKEKKIVLRGITEIVTPGLTSDDRLLDSGQNNFLASIHLISESSCGVSFLDLSTGEFFTAEGTFQFVEQLVQSLQPKELLFAKSKLKIIEQSSLQKFYHYSLEDWIFQHEFCRDKLLLKFETSTLKGFGIDDLRLAQIAAGSILYYLESTEKKHLDHITRISRLHQNEYVWMDKSTIRNLEITHPIQPEGKSLFDILDKTSTPMGSRLLKKMLLFPLVDKSAIDKRLESVEFFVEEVGLSKILSDMLKQIGDLERIVAKASLGKIYPREMLQLKSALEMIQKIKSNLYETPLNSIKSLGERLIPCPALEQKISDTIVLDPPVILAKGHCIKEGIHPQLDEYKHIIKNSKELLIEIQQKEIINTGIGSLKIGFNSVFGYYLEVTNKYKDQFTVPDSWHRKQTLSNGERYITMELKNLEEKILSAETKIADLELEVYDELIKAVITHIDTIQINASILANLDVLMSFANVSKRNNYAKPTINENNELAIVQGRHPVIEMLLPQEEEYVANDLYLSNEKQQIIIITGPNMSGKSALLRQTALIVLMAQAGCFVPATHAEIGIVDKIFTRVGASDNITSGESTFMVEMNETSSILNNFSDKSLILLDEIGRGTSTFDGISLAWSIAEYLHENDLAQPKTLFATHYHELNELANNHLRIKNYHVATKEIGQKVIFLRKLEQGGSHHSFGIHVARMAGMPNPVLQRAEQILNTLELNSIDGSNDANHIKNQLQQLQPPLHMTLVQPTDPLGNKLKNTLLELDLNTLTPIECMMKLQELKWWVDKSKEE